MKILSNIKKILFPIFTIAIPSLCFSQDASASKEETIEYIKNFFNTHQTESYLGRGESGTSSKNFKFAMIDDLISITFSDRWLYFENAFDQMELQFNIKDIESIYIGVQTGSPPCDANIVFVAFNKNLKIRTLKNGVSEQKSIAFIPYIGFSSSVCNKDFGDPQIVKAFNHLRKLSGAKSPIKFD